ncbi:CG17780 [Drosophila busckii]|uniref:CG17780 n=1 Tax=Drosophila busckii TaxID=30019 RepID=A0A0M4EJU7_DROBS|nr:CG17780 [Drosophila busckii]
MQPTGYCDEVNAIWSSPRAHVCRYGYGFRANYPFPEPKDQRKRNRVFFKRDLFSKLESALDGHGFDGRACLLKSFCTALFDVDRAQQKSGMLFKLLKLIFSLSCCCCCSALFAYKQTIPRCHIDAANATWTYWKLHVYLCFRVNVKNNVIPKPTIWAHGYGFRANTPVLVNRENRPFRRDTVELMHELLDRSGFDAQACVLKAYCSAQSAQQSQGFLFKLLKYMLALEDHEKHHLPYLREENCQQLLHSHCPLSFDSISPYTDDV